MILYNTTFIIDASAPADPFEQWARQRYIPAAMASPGVTGHTLALIANPDGVTDTRSYAVQFTADDEAAVAVWETTAAPLREEIERIYGHGRIVWFATYMDVLSEAKSKI